MPRQHLAARRRRNSCFTLPVCLSVCLPVCVNDVTSLRLYNRYIAALLRHHSTVGA